MFAIIDEQKFLLNHIAATRIVTSSIVLDCNLSPQQPAAGARADLDAALQATVGPNLLGWIPPLGEFNLRG